MATVKGVEALKKKLTAINKNLPKKVNDGLLTIAVKMHSTAVQNIQQISQGKEYGKHTASKAGDYPNVDTGDLLRSLFFDMNTITMTARFGVRDTLKYARYLEFGTSRMEPRPFIKPTKDKHLKEVEPLIAKIIQNAMKGSFK